MKMAGELKLKLRAIRTTRSSASCQERRRKDFHHFGYIICFGEDLRLKKTAIDPRINVVYEEN